MSNYLVFLVKSQNIEKINDVISGEKYFSYDENNNNLLHLAVSTGNLELVKIIYKASPFSLHSTNIDNYTPLDTALSRNFIEIANFLLEQDFVKINAMPILNYTKKNITDIISIKKQNVKRQIMENLFLDNKVNIGLLNILYTIKFIKPEIDDELLKPIINADLEFDKINFSLDELKVLKKLLQNQNDRRLINLILKEESPGMMLFLSTIIVQGIDIEELPLVKNKDINNLLDLRSKLEAFHHRKKQKDFKLNGILFNKIIKSISHSEYSFIIPRKNFDLIEQGEVFKNCIGNGNYARMINSNDSRIVLVYKEKKPYACIDISRNLKIRTIKAKRNKMLLDIVLKDLLELKLKKHKFLLHFDLI